MPTKDARILALEAIIDELDDRYGSVMETLAQFEKRIWVLEAPYRGAQEARRRREEKEKAKAAKKKTAKKKTTKKKEEAVAEEVKAELDGRESTLENEVS